MVKSHRRNYGGNRVQSNGAVPLSELQKQGTTPVRRSLVQAGGAQTGQPTTECSVCGLQVRVRVSDGNVRAHRIKDSGGGKWLCAGSTQPQRWDQQPGRPQRAECPECHRGARTFEDGTVRPHWNQNRRLCLGRTPDA